ncbi:hypothetical protein AM501_16380 [Aneurinibacillus migulanus]|uniref:Uncharacterized protein n=1 Tax=Aneurinibacillus migulanus TaxID=47500 RepID=A0A0D1XWI6_ANEMI|nr:hypothetical protein [Aneurinibacillus migulanus]KIV51457.1 hypothetical protein TS64_23750 [Aneurinibacillus migulanus]KIV54946.1 hypothetical protein TS65_17295 [Aneurinibacillus migulanus]KON94400.1 hypothetical protein AF333_01735 [Aneurinibacillus migulanus]KPD07297.1 hypothetical protein AM501_16380 [Aneurinibacillus migulanus]MCP1358210.1 hypothetical protein [Aneurinibacillus migulanus]
MDAPCAPAEERPASLFPTAPAHRPSFLSCLSPQEFVDLSNQMYIEEKAFIVWTDEKIGISRDPMSSEAMGKELVKALRGCNSISFLGNRIG